MIARHRSLPSILLRCPTHQPEYTVVSLAESFTSVPQAHDPLILVSSEFPVLSRRTPASGCNCNIGPQHHAFELRGDPCWCTMASLDEAAADIVIALLALFCIASAILTIILWRVSFENPGQLSFKFQPWDETLR